MNVFELFKEEAAGVGVIASKKQAKDPRYSHSLTVDVRPDTPKKNRKALGLTEATAKEKAAWLKIVQPYAERAADALETNPKFILDQWALESGYKIPKNNNIGGLTKQGEESGFREYDDLEGYTRDWVNQINKNFPAVKGVETMDDYVDALQTKGKLGVYAKEEPDEPTYRERLAGMKTGYVPDTATVSTTPATDTQAKKDIPQTTKLRTTGTATAPDPQTTKNIAQQATNQASRIARRQSAEDQKRAELEKRSKSGGPSAFASSSFNQRKAREEAEAEAKAARDIGKDTASTTTKTDTSVTTTPTKEEEKSNAEKGKEALPDSLSVKRKELEDAQAELDALTLNGTQEEVAKAQANVDEIEQAVQYNLDVQAGKDVVGGAGTLTKDETDYLKAKQNALMQGKDDVTSIADDDLNRRRAEAYANQQEGMGNTEVADFARAEAKRHEALRMQKLTKGITWGQGTLDQQEQQMKQWDKTKSEGGNPAQSWSGGTITDPKKLEDWQKRNTEADKLQKEKGQWTITKTIDDYRADVSSWGQEIQKAEAERKVDMSASGQAGTDDFMKSGPGIEPEKDPTVTTTPTEPEADDISDKFPVNKQRRNYRDKYSRFTPAFMMDEPDKQAVIARERLRRKAGELFRTNPAEWNKLYGGDKLGKAVEKAEQDAYAKFDEPQQTQKQASIVDKSTKLKPGRNTNLANNKIGDANGTISEPKSSIGQATVSTTPRTGPVTNANTQTFDAERQKAERQAKLDQQATERQARMDQQKAEQEAKKAEQKAKQEQQKAEQERKRQEQKAEQERKVSGSTQTVGGPVKLKPGGGPVPESAIFRAISGK